MGRNISRTRVFPLTNTIGRLYSIRSMTALAEAGANAQTGADTTTRFEEILDSAEILDLAVNRLLAGENIDNICSQYPCYADKLKSLLRAAQIVRNVKPPALDPIKKAQGLEKLLNQEQLKNYVR